MQTYQHVDKQDEHYNEEQDPQNTGGNWKRNQSIAYRGQPPKPPSIPPYRDETLRLTYFTSSVTAIEVCVNLALANRVLKFIAQ